MADTVVTIGLAVLTVACSGLTSAVVTHVLNRRYQQKTFLRDKAEKLYAATESFILDAKYNIIFYGGMIHSKRIPANLESFRDQIQEIENRNGGLEEITMITEIYFPSVKSTLENIIKLREDFATLCSSIHIHFENSPDSACAVTETAFAKVALELDNAMKGLRVEIVKAARLQSGIKK